MVSLIADEPVVGVEPHRAGRRDESPERRGVCQDAAIVVILVLVVSLLSMATSRAKSSLLSERASPTSRATTCTCRSRS